MDGCLSTLVDLDHAEIHRLFASEDYVNATNYISLPGKERVTVANLKSLLEKRQNLKKAVRCGTDRDVRKTYWLSTVAISRPGDTYRMALKDVSEEDTDVKLCPTPEEFGWLHPTDCYSLAQQRGLDRAPQRRILHALKMSHPSLSYCSLLPVFVTLSANFLEEGECFCLMDEILHRPGWMCSNQRENLSSINTLISLFKARCKHACQEVVKHNRSGKSVDAFLGTVLASWREWIFCNQPFWFLVRLLDIFYEVGPKVLYRMALGCLVLYVDKKLLAPGSGLPVNIATDLPEFLNGLTWEGRGLWFKAAMSIKLSRQHLKQVFFTELAGLPPPNLISQHEADRQPSKLTEEEFALDLTDHMKSSMAGEDRHWNNIWGWIPEWAKIMRPHPIYKASSDGYNLRSVYRKAADKYPLLLFVKTKNKEIIGAFISSTLDERKSVSQSKFFGCGETFLFSLEPVSSCYQWSGESDLILLAKDNEFAVGAGGGSYGLWIDGDLNHGSSSHCTAYQNPPLVESGQFDIVNLELLAFQ